VPITREWIRDLLQLKRTPRAGWFRIGVEQPESVADHSFAMALLAWRIAREIPGIDAVRVALMALLHDFPEARLTDIPDPAKKCLPEGAFADAEERVTAEQWPADTEAIALLQEFRAGETEEAKLARACDNLEFLIQAAFYRDAGRAQAGRMLARAKRGAAWGHPVTRPIVEELLEDGAG
jgi:putative hydrolase of HD superfamily